jgi:cation diffusion facilitator CzcD-associated flavoprotein CzcO
MRLYVEEHGCRDEFKQLELDRTNVYNGPFEVPSTSIFNTFCQTIIKRYHLDNAVTEGSVRKLEIFPVPSPAEASQANPCSPTPLVRVTCSDGTLRWAKQVVVAVGSLATPRIPEWAGEWMATKAIGLDVLVHATTLMTQDPAQWVSPRDKRLLIVGAGLTAGHLAVRACKEGQTGSEPTATTGTPH